MESVVPPILEIRVSCDSVELADRIAEALVLRRAAACVHRSTIESRYDWADRLVTETEYLLTVITTERARSRAVGIIGDHHSYELPAIVWTRLEATEDYRRWVVEQTSDGTDTGTTGV